MQIYQEQGQEQITYNKKIQQYKFSTTNILGKGASGVVYKGICEKSGKTVAIKVLDPKQVFSNEYNKQLMQQEISIMKSIKHPNVVTLYDVFQTQNSIYLITEYCDGKDLEFYFKEGKNIDLLKKNNQLYEQKQQQQSEKSEFENNKGYNQQSYQIGQQRMNSKFSDSSQESQQIQSGEQKFLHEISEYERVILKIFKDILLGVQELYKKGILHRDLKLANVLKDKNTYKLTDFGFSRNIDSQNQLMESCVGTPYYMSPQLLLRNTYSSKCEVWSLGIILYEMLFGDVPFPSTNYVDLVKNVMNNQLVFKNQVKVSRQAKDLLYKCLQKNEFDRLSLDELFNYPYIFGEQNFEAKIKNVQNKISTFGNGNGIYSHGQIQFIKNELNNQNLPQMTKLGSASPQKIKSPVIKQSQKGLKSDKNYAQTALKKQQIPKLKIECQPQSHNDINNNINYNKKDEDILTPVKLLQKNQDFDLDSSDENRYGQLLKQYSVDICQYKKRNNQQKYEQDKIVYYQEPKLSSFVSIDNKIFKYEQNEYVKEQISDQIGQEEKLEQQKFQQQQQGQQTDNEIYIKEFGHGIGKKEEKNQQVLINKNNAEKEHNIQQNFENGQLYQNQEQTFNLNFKKNEQKTIKVQKNLEEIYSNKLIQNYLQTINMQNKLELEKQRDSVINLVKLLQQISLIQPVPIYEQQNYLSQNIDEEKVQKLYKGQFIINKFIQFQFEKFQNCEENFTIEEFQSFSKTQDYLQIQEQIQFMKQQIKPIYQNLSQVIQNNLQQIEILKLEQENQEDFQNYMKIVKTDKEIEFLYYSKKCLDFYLRDAQKKMQEQNIQTNNQDENIQDLTNQAKQCLNGIIRFYNQIVKYCEKNQIDEQYIESVNNSNLQKQQLINKITLSGKKQDQLIEKCLNDDNQVLNIKNDIINQVEAQNEEQIQFQYQQQKLRQSSENKSLKLLAQQLQQNDLQQISQQQVNQVVQQKLNQSVNLELRQNQNIMNYEQQQQQFLGCQQQIQNKKKKSDYNLDNNSNNNILGFCKSNPTMYQSYNHQDFQQFRKNENFYVSLQQQY